ncbi:MAG: PRC-barrel domain-containing protein [Clostridia bacterium]|nr:PRC-barrel domain-containing protein [Clostridia bacterium]
MYEDRAHAVELGEDEHFIVDLVGLKGYDENGRELGELTEVMQPGGNDVYVFVNRRTKKELLVPAIKRAILSTDVAGGRMILYSKALEEVAVENDI